jgi:hypothetical protein
LKTEDDVELKNVMERAANWLLEVQDQNGGWADRPGRASNTLNTAEAVIALLDARAIAPGDAYIQKAKTFLLRHQRRQQPDKGAWSREIAEDGGRISEYPDIVRTSAAVVALIKAGEAVNQEPLTAALDWLLEIQNSDGGWGYRRGISSCVMPTCFALLAVIEVYDAGNIKTKAPIENGLSLLVKEYRQQDRAFGPSGPLQAVSTIYSILVLQGARRIRPNVARPARRLPRPSGSASHQIVLTFAAGKRRAGATLARSTSRLLAQKEILTGCVTRSRPQ